MKLILPVLLFSAAYASAQLPVSTARPDSIPDIPFSGTMPIARPGNSFYRDHRDPNNVVRATLDNMPVKVPDSSEHFFMQQVYPPSWQRIEPNRQRPGLPPIVPGKPEK
jgi:hypothetical protein